MNDRYLFKAKRKDNGEWILGSLVCGDGYFEIAVRHEDDLLMTRHEVEPSTICQFTTLTDKNGERIWEGDRIEIEWEFDNETTCEIIPFSSDYGYWMYGCNPICELFDPVKKPMTVIGNIHDTLTTPTL